jgi:hypothetical protein
VTLDVDSRVSGWYIWAMHRRVCFLSALPAATALVACSAFISEPSCGRYRRVSAFDTLPNVAFALTLLDQDPHQKSAYLWNRVDFIDWSVTVPQQAVTAMHLHLRDDGRLLWDLTRPDDEYSPGYTAAQSIEYSHDTDIGNLFNLVRDGRTYIDVHTKSASEPILRADVTHMDFNDWETEHACST